MKQTYRKSQTLMFLFRMHAITLAVMLGVLLGSSGRLEATIVFNDQTSFLNAVGSVVTEDFEDEPAGHPDYGALSAMTFDDFSATSTPAALKVLDAEWYGNHNTTPGGRKYLSADTDVGSRSSEVTITFDYVLSALGFYLIDIEDFMEITIGGNLYTVPGNGTGGESYFGIISDSPFSVVHLDMGVTDSHTSMDDFAYVPEPTTICLLGLGGLSLLRRRRRKT